MLRRLRFCRPPRRRWRGAALKALSAVAALFLVLHAASCGLLSFAGLPGWSGLSTGMYDDLRDISVLPGGPGLASGMRRLWRGAALPLHGRADQLWLPHLPESGTVKGG